MSCSRSRCSSSESTSLRVEKRCCDSTTRQARPASRRRLDLPPQRVQIFDGIDEPGDGADALRGNAAQMAVGRVHPLPCLFRAPPEEGVEAAEEAHEEDGQ